MTEFQPLLVKEKLKLCENLGISLQSHSNDFDGVPLELGMPLQTHKIDGDGNCLFRAISYAISGTEDHHAYIRNVLVSYMKSNKFGQKLCPNSSQEYLETSKMDLCGTWGTDVELLVASSFFGADIFVFSKYGPNEDWLKFKPEHNHYQVHGAIYLHHKNGNHYDFVISVKSNLLIADADRKDKIMQESMEISDNEGIKSEDFPTVSKEQNTRPSSSDEDVYDFDIMEFHSPISTSTPCKKGSQVNDDRIKMDSETHGIDVSVYNSSFEEAVSLYKKPTPSHKPSTLCSKALKNIMNSIIKSCMKQCLKSISDKAIFTMREKLWAKPFECRVEWFVDKVTESVDDKAQKKVLFNVDGGKKVCGPCFRQLYRLDKNFYYKYLKKAGKGVLSSGIRRGRSLSMARTFASAWLDTYVYFHADRMPDNGDMMLPYKTRKKDVYHMYGDEMAIKFKSSVSQSLFYDVWKEKRNLKIKQTNSFSKCNTCVHLEREMEKTRDVIARTELKKMVAVHNERQMSERRYYYTKREKAKSKPNMYLSLIIDGMDQSKTNLPHFTGRLLKGVDPNSFLKTHVQGILNHGCGIFRCYVDINEYSHDSNLVMNTLLRAIHEAQSKLKTLPGTLYIQADNCGRENKNKYVLSFCELLVHLQIFHEVHLSFLPVGHTHEDIDAKFSTLADLLRRNDAETLPALLHILPNSVQTRGLFDIRKWIEPYINTVTQHSKPLHFKFYEADGKLSLQYKSSCHKMWSNSEHTLLTGMPTGQPSVLVPPHFNKIVVSSLRDNILKHKYNMTDRQFWWWHRFLEEINSLQSDVTSMDEYACQGAVWLLNDIKAQPKEDHQRPTSKQHLTDMIDKELDDHKIIVSSKQKRKHDTRAVKEVN